MISIVPEPQLPELLLPGLYLFACKSDVPFKPLLRNTFPGYEFFDLTRDHTYVNVIQAESAGLLICDVGRLGWQDPDRGLDKVRDWSNWCIQNARTVVVTVYLSYSKVVVSKTIQAHPAIRAHVYGQISYWHSLRRLALDTQHENFGPYATSTENDRIELLGSFDSQLSQRDLEIIRRYENRHNEPVTQKQLAAEYGISQGRVSKLVSRPPRAE